MAVKMVFEDNENTPSSIMLKSGFYGQHIYFANGVSQILNKAMGIRDSGDTVYIFYDMSPNNIKTVKGYETLVVELKSDKSKYEGLYVIPIICIEYYICQMLYRYGYLCVQNSGDFAEMMDKLVATFDWCSLPDKFKNDAYVSCSLEHAYKRVVNTMRLPCLRNTFKYNMTGSKREVKSPLGIFYEKDCNCDRVYCPINCDDSLKLKAERLYCTLPFFVVENSAHKDFLVAIGITSVNVSYRDIILERRNFYKNICENMSLKMPNVSF